MPVIEQPEPPVRAQVARTLSRHIEVTLYALGVVTGVALSLLVAVLT